LEGDRKRENGKREEGKRKGGRTQREERGIAPWLFWDRCPDSMPFISLNQQV